MKGMKKDNATLWRLHIPMQAELSSRFFDCFSKRTHVHKRNTESSITRPHGSFQQIGYCDRFDLKN